MSKSSPNSVDIFLKSRNVQARRYIGASVILSCLNGFFLIVSAWLLAHNINNAIFYKTDEHPVTLLLCLALLLYVIRAGLLYGSEHLAFLGADKVKASVREDILTCLTHSGSVSRNRESSGVILNTYIEGVEALQGYYMQTLPSRMTATIVPLAIFLIILPFDFMSGLVLLMTAPLIPVFMIWIGRGAERLNQRQWRRMTFMGGRFLDVIQGLSTLKLFGASYREISTLRRLGEEFRCDTMAVLRIAFLSSLAMEFFATVSIALIAVLIGFRLLWGEMAFVEGFFILLLAPDFFQPLRKMGAHYHAKMEAIGASEKIVSLLNAEGRDHHQGDDFPVQSVSIEFRNVFFSYDSGVPILRGVSFNIKAGETVAIAGQSGSGKSTILALIMGFIVPQSGEILINGKNLNEIAPIMWRRSLSWVGQKPHLFPGSIADNIRMGRSDASDSDIIKLLSQCGIDDISEQILEENGGGLSGGQAQRVAIARALVRKSPLLLLDEPTAHLDQVTENLIQRTVAEISGSSTVIFSAHRSATLAAADRILLLKNGFIAEADTEAGT